MKSLPTSGGPLGLLLLSLLAPAAVAQDASVQDRLQALERENAELSRRIDLLAETQEQRDLGAVAPGVLESVTGLGPAASKVYQVDGGVSVGGYGEGRYTDVAGGDGDQTDLLRAVLYVGYRFDERWVFNSETEIEHASTGETGSTSVEFAYLEYLASDALRVRTGLLLPPMGFLNELHEPTTYLAANRPETEQRIIPSTWREVGVGVVGESGGVDYRAYVVTGLDGVGFSEAGLRGGRQKGSRSRAEDLAVVARADWTGCPGWLFGGSVYHGNSGQGRAGVGSAGTTIVELHGEYRSRGVWVRGLVARAEVDDADRINAVRAVADPTLGPGDSVGEELTGAYLEAGYDVWPLIDPESEVVVSPYVRYEMIDTQAEVPAGGLARARNDNEILTFGVHWMPIPSIVFKADYQDYDSLQDRLTLSMGYTF